MAIVLGTQWYRAEPDAMRRQERAITALAALRDVIPINLQWTDAAYERPEVETVATLRRDSSQVTTLPGRRRPIMPEMFDALADVAAARDCRYFGLLNADIVVLQAAVETIVRGGKDGYVFSRMDFDPSTGADRQMVLDGLDLFAFDVAWWRAQRRRFRPYILGEWCGDNVIAALLMCYGDGLILNREGEIRHAAHAHAVGSAQGLYNHYLAALDAPYFSLWVKYRWHLDEARARGASAAEELVLQRAAFNWRPSLADTVWHAARSVKARWVFRRRESRWTAD